MIHKLGKTNLTLLILVLSMSLVACAVSAVVTQIQIAIDLITVGAPIVAAFAGPGATLITTYMTAAANGLNCVLTAAQAPGATTAIVAAAFGTCLAAAILPNLPAGVPPEIAAIVTAVASVIKFLVERFGSASKLALAKSMPMHLTRADHSKISSMQKQLGVALQQLAHK